MFNRIPRWLQPSWPAMHINTNRKMQYQKVVVCPTCKTKITLQNKKGKAEGQVRCPMCQTLLTVKFKEQEEPVEAHTYYAPQQPRQQPRQQTKPNPHQSYARNSYNNGETQLGGAPYSSPYESRRRESFGGGETQLGGFSSDGAQQEKANCQTMLVCNGTRYQLTEGRNVIGRQGKTSEATVQIPTNDLYMSRQHCVINVKMLPDGSAKAVLSNFKNKNETKINGHTIASGDAIILQDGNTITMGNTTATYNIQRG